jgi:hypothetical protein
MEIGRKYINIYIKEFSRINKMENPRQNLILKINDDSNERHVPMKFSFILRGKSSKCPIKYVG